MDKTSLRFLRGFVVSCGGFQVIRGFASVSVPVLSCSGSPKWVFFRAVKRGDRCTQRGANVVLGYISLVGFQF